MPNSPYFRVKFLQRRWLRPGTIESKLYSLANAVTVYIHYLCPATNFGIHMQFITGLDEHCQWSSENAHLPRAVTIVMSCFDHDQCRRYHSYVPHRVLQRQSSQDAGPRREQPYLKMHRHQGWPCPFRWPGPARAALHQDPVPATAPRPLCAVRAGTSSVADGGAVAVVAGEIIDL